MKQRTTEQTREFTELLLETASQESGHQVPDSAERPDDCDEFIPLWFCRDVVDSEVSSSEHISGFKAAYMAL